MQLQYKLLSFSNYNVTYFTLKEIFFSTYINWLVDEELDSEYDAESSMLNGEELV